MAGRRWTFTTEHFYFSVACARHNGTLHTLQTTQLVWHLRQSPIVFLLAEPWYVSFLLGVFRRRRHLRLSKSGLWTAPVPIQTWPKIAVASPGRRTAMGRF
jgi:hypothetical protein